jgi:hypothetical protein
MADLPPRPNPADVASALAWAEGKSRTRLFSENFEGNLRAEVLHLRAQLDRMDRDRAYYADQLMAVTTGLRPLCPCAPEDPNNDGPHQECPVHGDGETHVRYVRALENAARAAYGPDALRVVWQEVSS